MTSKAPRSVALKWLVRVAIGAGGLLAAVVAAAFIFVFTFDVERYRSELEATASQIVGRAVTIEGPITLGRSLVPKLVAHDVHVANPAWASRLYGARAERLEIELELLPLFNSQLKVVRIALIDFDVLLETSGCEPWPAFVKKVRHAGQNLGALVMEGHRFEFINSLALYRRRSGWSTESLSRHDSLTRFTIVPR